MSAKQKDVGSSLTLDQLFCACNFGFVRLFANFLMSQKGPPFNFFDTWQQSYLGFVVRLFFANFLYISKGSPLQFFSILQEWMFKNSQRPPFYLFWHCATYRRPKKNRKKTF